MDLGTIRIGKYVVIQCELETGLVLTSNGNRRLGSGEIRLVFDSLEEAKAYSRQRVLVNPEIECNIYNHLNERILTLNNLKNGPFRDSSIVGNF